MELVERNKGICFTDHRMWDWTFENDDGTVPQMAMAKRYVENWDKVRQEHIGFSYGAIWAQERPIWRLL